MAAAIKNTDELLIELNKSNFTMFNYDYEGNECHLELKDDFEIMLQLSNGVLSKQRIELLKHVLQNYEKYTSLAIKHLKSFNIDIGDNYFSYGVYIGEYSFGTHVFHIFDGFTVSLKREMGEADDYLNMRVYTVQFKNDGRPLGIDLWFE